MSDELERDPADPADPEALSPGAARLARAALQSPAPNPEAETAAQERALSAYHESLLAPRALHADPWRPGPPSLTARIGRFFRRLGGG